MFCYQVPSKRFRVTGSGLPCSLTRFRKKIHKDTKGFKFLRIFERKQEMHETRAVLGVFNDERF